jgi:hypothetical protein
MAAAQQVERAATAPARAEPCAEAGERGCAQMIPLLVTAADKRFVVLARAGDTVEQLRGAVESTNFELYRTKVRAARARGALAVSPRSLTHAPRPAVCRFACAPSERRAALKCRLRIAPATCSRRTRRSSLR